MFVFNLGVFMYHGASVASCVLKHPMTNGNKKGIDQRMLTTEENKFFFFFYFTTSHQTSPVSKGSKKTFSDIFLHNKNYSRSTWKVLAK
jgi:hypothetical protein